MNKIYKTGLYCGRFQPMHKGHIHVIRIGLELCDKLLILIGSAQEEGTPRNPFSIQTRMKIINKIFAKEIKEGRIILAPLTDLNKNPEENITADWGRYVLENAKIHLGELPKLMVYGNDDARSKWFDPEDIKNIGEIIVSRSAIKVSATDVRKHLINGNDNTFKELTHESIGDMYNELRDILLSIDNN